MIPDHIFNKHRDCDVYIDENPVSRKGRPKTVHYASLCCRTCRKHLKILSGQELVALGRISQDELDQYQQLKKQARFEAQTIMLADQDQPVKDSW
jgi:hypothetical protein